MLLNIFTNCIHFLLLADKKSFTSKKDVKNILILKDFIILIFSLLLLATNFLMPILIIKCTSNKSKAPLSLIAF